MSDASGHFWKRWVLHYSVAELLAMAVSSLMARFVFVAFFGNTFSSSFVVFIVLLFAGLMEGLMIGYLQWKSFPRLFSQFNIIPWMIVTVVFTIAAWLFVLPPAVIIISLIAELRLVRSYPFLYTIIVGIGFGAMISIPQTFILRRFYQYSIYWVSGNVIGWVFSFVIFYLAISLLERVTIGFLRFLLIAIACMLSGFFQGSVTGISLHFLMVKKSNDGINIRDEGIG